MAFIYYCSYCRQKMEVPDEMEYSFFKCPDCKRSCQLVNYSKIDKTGICIFVICPHCKDEYTRPEAFPIIKTEKCRKCGKPIPGPVPGEGSKRKQPVSYGGPATPFERSMDDLAGIIVALIGYFIVAGGLALLFYLFRFFGSLIND